MIISCTRCRDTIEAPNNTVPLGTERWCKCGLTYARRTEDGFAYGGPGNPIVRESEVDRPDLDNKPELVPSLMTCPACGVRGPATHESDCDMEY